MTSQKPKIIVVLGQTATGKSDLGVQLAKKFNGEVVSADSRQVYKGLDIGTGKVPRDKKLPTNYSLQTTNYFYKGVPHHLLDVISPKRQFTVAEYKKLADEKIKEITERGKVPVLVGGTGFYIQAVVDGIVPPEVPPNTELRKKLEKKSFAELLKMLEKLDPERALAIDSQNPRRLIRAIEIAKTLGKVPKIKKRQKYDVLMIGLQMDDRGLKETISKRLFARINPPTGGGMIGEAKELHNPPTGRGLSWKRMEELGFDQKYIAQYLQKKISKEEMIEKLINANWHYAKRQKTWFKRDKRIHWFKPHETKKIEKLIKGFLE